MKLLAAGIFVGLVSLFTYYADPIYGHRLDVDLRAKTQSILAENGYGHLTARVTRHELSLTGEIESPHEIILVENLVSDLWGIDSFDLVGVVAVPKTIASLDARESADGEFTLSGILPSSATQELFANAVRTISGSSLDDSNIELVPEAHEPRWRYLGAQLLKELGTLAEEATLSISESQIALGGILDSKEDHLAVLKLARQASGESAHIRDKLQVILWRESEIHVERKGEIVTIGGVFPDEPGRVELVDHLAKVLGGSQLIDKTSASVRIRPVWWSAHALAFVPEFFDVTIGDAELRYDGSGLWTRSAAAHSSLKIEIEAMAGKLAGDRAIRVNLVLPPDNAANIVVWLDEGAVVLTGNVCSVNEATAVEEAVAAANPRRRIYNELSVIRELASATWITGLRKALPPLFDNADTAIFSACDKFVQIEGIVRSEAVREKIGSAVSAAYGEQILVSNLIMKPPPAPQVPEEFRELAKKLSYLALYFRESSTYISPNELIKIKRSAELIRSADIESELKLVVGGYSRRNGNAVSNRSIALERANAVRIKLTAAGVPESMLRVEHFTQDTSRISRRDLWKVRRVELSIDLNLPN